jgi:hypothetical protein
MEGALGVKIFRGGRALEGASGLVVDASLSVSVVVECVLWLASSCSISESPSPKISQSSPRSGSFVVVLVGVVGCGDPRFGGCKE